VCETGVIGYVVYFLLKECWDYWAESLLRQQQHIRET
jgi:hypothetical protein